MRAPPTIAGAASAFRVGEDLIERPLRAYRRANGRTPYVLAPRDVLGCVGIDSRAWLRHWSAADDDGPIRPAGAAAVSVCIARCGREPVSGTLIGR